LPGRNRQKRIGLSIYLIKGGIEEASVFHSLGDLSIHDISVGDQAMGRLYLRQSHEHPPTWLTLFGGRANPRLGNIVSKNSSAVWIVPIGERLFACAFGYGRTLLNPGAFEEDFGLKVTLNSVDPDKLHSIDRTTLDTISKHSKIQASHLAPIGEFGLDVEQDILQGVTGEPADSSLGAKLSGKDSLHVSLRIELRDLPDLLERYLALYASRRYKDFFAFVDHIRLIRDPTRQQSLNLALVDKIREQNAERLWLSAPEAIDWLKISYFCYKPSRQKGQYEDLHLSQLVSEVRELGEVGLERLKSIRILGMSAENDLAIYDWPLFKCINYEVETGNRTHILNNGKWYEIASDFATAVANTCRAVRYSDIELPAYEDKDEAAYNLRVAESDPARFVSFDRRTVVFPASPSRIEFCDIYTHSREMIFIKRYQDSKVLSHLFAQGMVSAETFRREKQFREMISRHLPDTHGLGIFLNEMTAHDFTVTFAIISSSAKPLHESLPFFSKVNLRNAVKLLESNGYNVRLAKIQQQRRPLPEPEVA
jgi:uncharacterized protein (TIGR04141 family)